MVAMIPVSVRDGPANRRWQQGVGDVGLAADPVRQPRPPRLTAVHGDEGREDQQAAIPAGLVDAADFVPPALVARPPVSRPRWLVAPDPPFNLVTRMFRARTSEALPRGAKLIAIYPVPVVTDGQGFNITVNSYGGQMHFGLIGCRELTPTSMSSRDTSSRNLTSCSDSRAMSRRTVHDGDQTHRPRRDKDALDYVRWW